MFKRIHADEVPSAEKRRSKERWGRDRGRERERENIYIYIYIYIERERDSVYIYIYILVSCSDSPLVQHTLTPTLPRVTCVCVYACCMKHMFLWHFLLQLAHGFLGCRQAGRPGEFAPRRPEARGKRFGPRGAWSEKGPLQKISPQVENRVWLPSPFWNEELLRTQDEGQEHRY